MNATEPETHATKNFSDNISVFTEMPDNHVGNQVCGWVFYDADCALCTGMLNRFGRVFVRRGFVFVPLQDAICTGEFEIPPEEFLREMKLLRPDGVWLGGADAWIGLFQRVWYLRPLGFLATLPGLHGLAHASYRSIAAHRHCLTGSCALPNPSDPGKAAIQIMERESVTRSLLVREGARQRPMTAGFLGVAAGHRPALRFIVRIAAKKAAQAGSGVRVFAILAPMLMLIATTFALKPFLAPWVFMWALAFAIYAGCKWATLLAAMRRGTQFDLQTAALYLFAWTGMNATTFGQRNKVDRPTRGEALAAVFKLFIGTVILWGLLPLIHAAPPLVIGWLGMTGVVLMLHFGVFHIASVLLRQMGFNAPVMMNAPLAARNIAEFWGIRWNQPFHELTTRFLFRPVTQRLGARAALLVCFLASGLIHDLLISVPAGGGYGLPTLYFAIQGVGLIGEKLLFRRRRNGMAQRLFTWAVVAGPVGLLFPPVFVERIILPMLNALGAY